MTICISVRMQKDKIRLIDGRGRICSCRKHPHIYCWMITGEVPNRDYGCLRPEPVRLQDTLYALVCKAHWHTLARIALGY